MSDWPRVYEQAQAEIADLRSQLEAAQRERWFFCDNCKPLFVEPREDWPCMNCALIAERTKREGIEARGG